MQDRYAWLVVGCSVMQQLFETLKPPPPPPPPTLGITGKKERQSPHIHWLVVQGR